MRKYLERKKRTNPVSHIYELHLLFTRLSSLLATMEAKRLSPANSEMRKMYSGAVTWLDRWVRPKWEKKWEKYTLTYTKEVKSTAYKFGIAMFIPAITEWEAEIHPTTTGHTHTITHTHAHTERETESTINLLFIFLGCERNLKYLEKNHTGMRRTASCHNSII